MTNRSLIIQQLSSLSKNGWRDAKPYDYEPLEAELRKMDAKAMLAAQNAMFVAACQKQDNGRCEGCGQ